MTISLGNTLTVWHALFLRECLDRFFGSRAGWAWLAIEPAAHILIIGTWLSLSKYIPNADAFTWVTIGMLAFFLFRRSAVQIQHAVDCNKSFFAFRQVRPFDAALSRGAVEGFSMFLVALVIFVPLAFLGKQIIPADPLLLTVSMFGLWMLALGYGMIVSVIQCLVPETGHIFMILMMPLYFISGVIFPLTQFPPVIRKYIMYNPILHGLEYARYAFFHHYYILPEISLSYLYTWVMILLFVGLILYKLFETRLIRR